MAMGQINRWKIGSVLAGVVLFCVASLAEATPSINFDINGLGSSATVSNIGGICVLCSATTTLASGLDSEIFSLQQGQSYTFDFFDITVSGLFAKATADVTAILAFQSPTSTSVTGLGSGGFATIGGVLSGGSLTWNAFLPPVIVLPNGSTFTVTLSNIHAFGLGNTATVQATVTATHVAAVSEPGILFLFALGLASLRFACRGKAA